MKKFQVIFLPSGRRGEIPEAGNRTRGFQGIGGWDRIDLWGKEKLRKMQDQMGAG